MPSAFQGEKLNEKAWNEILVFLNAIRKNKEGTLFAVRSSALSEDSAQASFAGEFKTVLNVGTDKEIQEAIYAVFRSRQPERVKASMFHLILNKANIGPEKYVFQPCFFGYFIDDIRNFKGYHY